MGQLNDHHLAVQQALLTVTLLPTAPQLVSFVKGNAQATMQMHRTLVRAASTTGVLSLDLYVVLTVIPHYPAFTYAIGTDLGAPAALGLLLAATRAALNSSTAELSLGNVAIAAERYKYLLGRVKDLHDAQQSASERVAFLTRELEVRRAHESFAICYLP